MLPFYVERLALQEGSGTDSVTMHIGALTAVYPLAQLFSPVWGKLSDKIGRKPPVLTGVVGYAAAQVLFGISNHRWL